MEMDVLQMKGGKFARSTTWPSYRTPRTSHVMTGDISEAALRTSSSPLQTGSGMNPSEIDESQETIVVIVPICDS